jgi:hypothetical protein
MAKKKTHSESDFPDVRRSRHDRDRRLHRAKTNTATPSAYRGYCCIMNIRECRRVVLFCRMAKFAWAPCDYSTVLISFASHTAVTIEIARDPSQSKKGRVHEPKRKRQYPFFNQCSVISSSATCMACSEIVMGPPPVAATVMKQGKL